MSPPNILDPTQCVVPGIHKHHVWFTAVESQSNPGFNEIVAWNCAGTRDTTTEEQQ